MRYTSSTAGSFDTDTSSLVELEEKIKYQAYHDSLTSLSNRALKIGSSMSYVKRYKNSSL